jgi:hypothetical protein
MGKPSLVASEVMIRAAKIIEQEAKTLRECQTVDGRWDDSNEIDAAAHTEHDEWLRVASALRELCRPSLKVKHG